MNDLEQILKDVELTFNTHKANVEQLYDVNLDGFKIVSYKKIAEIYGCSLEDFEVTENEMMRIDQNSKIILVNTDDCKSLKKERYSSYLANCLYNTVHEMCHTINIQHDWHNRYEIFKSPHIKLEGGIIPVLIIGKRLRKLLNIGECVADLCALKYLEKWLKENPRWFKNYPGVPNYEYFNPIFKPEKYYTSKKKATYLKLEEIFEEEGYQGLLRAINNPKKI